MDLNNCTYYDSDLTIDNEFSAMVAGEYLKHFNFGGLRVDAALRSFLARFCLVGESSERERIVQYFSRRYHECNPSVFESEDKVHTLAVALLLLNTDLHGQTVGRRMSCRDFIDNLSQNSPHLYSRDLLKSLYNSIKGHPIELVREPGSSSETTTDSGLPSRSLQDHRFVTVPDPDTQVEYKKGWVLRKAVFDVDGKRTPKGRRNWQMFYATLKGLIMYLHKDENGFKKGSFHVFRNAIRVHHALATKATDYKKKQHVFRLRTANFGEYLFQTSNPNELQEWVDSINYVAAAFSSPPLPAPVCAKQAFHRPTFPSNPSKLSLRDQLNEHERRISEIDLHLESHRANAPPLSAKGRLKEEYADVEIFLQAELWRFKTYVYILRSKLEEFLDVPTSSSGDVQLREFEDMQSSDNSCGSSNGNNSTTGQSDRHSYKAAISATSSHQRSTSYETTF